MASLRHGSRPKPGRSDDRSPSTRMGMNPSTSGLKEPAALDEEISSTQPRQFRLGMDLPRPQGRQVATTAPRSRLPGASGIPQVTPGSRRPSAPGRDHSRPPLTHQDKPWGANSIRSVPNTNASSRASPARMPNERGLPIRKDSNPTRQTASAQQSDSRSTSERTDSSSSSSFARPPFFSDSPDWTQLDRGLTESPTEVHIAMRVELPTTSAQTVRIYPELDRYRDVKPPTVVDVPYPLATHDLPPPTPLFSGTSSGLSGYSGSPSTRFSESPGPGPYSRDTTPTTSISSQSPGLMAPHRIAATRQRQNSPAAAHAAHATLTTPHARPPVTRRRAGSIPHEVDSISADPQGLAAVREALTSSSSNSTVRDGDRRQGSERGKERENDPSLKKKKKTTRLDALPPNPPPRKSSQKFKKDGSRDEEPSPSRPPREPAQPIMTPPSPERAQPPAPTTRTASRTGRPTETTPAVTQQPVTSRPSRSLARGAPPTRPSRDGTPDLQSQLGLPLPVIHSNLSSTSLSERRQSIPLGPGSRNQSIGAASRQPLQPPSKLPVVDREPTPAPLRSDGGSSSSAIPTAGRRSSKSGSAAASRTPSPSVSTFRSLFGRRTKTAPPPPTDAPSTVALRDRTSRKGPAAGTGHEGYGRIGASHQRRRSSGTLARGLSGTMSSQESLELSLSDDPFLQERINPVVIAGGAIIQNQNRSQPDSLSRTESNQSLPSGYSRTASDVSLSSREERTTLWPSPFPRSTTPTPSLGSRRPSDSSDSEALAMRTTLAFRRSVQKLKGGADQSALRIPKPIVVRAPPSGITSPAVTSYDTTVMSDDSAFNVSPKMPPRGRGLPAREASSASVSTSTSASAMAAATPKKLTKRPKSPRRWNFFGRSSSQPATAVKKKATELPRPVAATVTAVQSKPVAFYTMIDSSEQEDNCVMNVQDVLRDANLLSAPSPRPQSPPRLQRPMTRERRPSASGRSIASIDAALRAPSREAASGQMVNGCSTPEMPYSRGTPILATPEPYTSTPEPTAPSPVPPHEQQTVRPAAGRPSRLPQVGRIPKVVSARPEQTSPKSFSRPFNRVSVQMPFVSGVVDMESVAKGPSPIKPSTPELETEQLSLEGPTYGADGEMSTAMPNSRLPDYLHDISPEMGASSTTSGAKDREFLSFSPRKGSQCTSTTTTSTSSGGLYSYADATAVVPAPYAPLAEDEVWLEYDDLLGDEGGPKVPPSAGSSQGTPFYLEGYADRLLAKQGTNPLESPTVASHQQVLGQTVEQANVEIEREPVASSIYSTDLTSQLDDALETGVIPISSPFSVSDFVSGYGDPAISVEPLRPSQTKATAHATATVTVVQRNSNSSTNSSALRRTRGHQRTSDASGASSQFSNDNSPLSQVNLRVGSMTVSKWLTFGHVLFSPVRDEVAQIVPVGSPLDRHSILVIDGLGNDDWSFYAAETYPNVTFFNLSPRAPLPGSEVNRTGRDSNSASSGSSPSSFPLTPPNHHQIQYMSHLDRFPFAPESFTAVVYRFPVAAPEAHYRNIVSEARRVLKPGGFIELSILDLDLNNMGNRARRVVRRLKERINAASSETSLGSTADLLLRVMGRRGFEDIKSCRVGVPVASAIASAVDSAASTSSATQPVPKKKRAKDDRSLAEMMSDESAVADESITKMVAKVGRWWFTRCYESAAAPSSSAVATIWNDKALIAECEEWFTSLKLMVCHARVPDDGRARVASI